MLRTRLSACAIALIAFVITPVVGAERLFVGFEPFPVRQPAGALAIADFDGDSRPDVAVAHEATGSVSVLPNLGNPLLGSQRSYDVGAGPVDLLAGDINDDSAPDLVSVNSGSGTISVLLNDGAGDFLEAVHVPVGSGPRVAMFEDFDDDGRVDVAVTNLRGNSLVVLYGDGAGGFAEFAVVEVGDNPHNIAVADFDGDGDADVAVAHSGAVSIFAAVGKRRFERLADIFMTPDPRFIASAELNGDGHPDIVVISDEGHVRVLELAAGQPIESRELEQVPGFNRGIFQFGFLTVVDFDRDGFLDIVTPLFEMTDTGIRVFHGDASVDFSRRENVYIDTPMVDFEFEDLDGDGIVDAVLTHAELSAVVVVRGLEPAYLSARRALPLECGPRDLEVIDVDGDGAFDIACVSSRGVHIVRSNRKGGFEPEIFTEFHGRSFLRMATADFDGDGIVDVAAGDLLNGHAVVAFLDSAGDVSRRVAHDAGVFPGEIVAADPDADGRPDLVVADQAEDSFHVILDPGRDAGGESISVNVGSPQSGLAVGDLDGDARLDLVIATRDGLAFLRGDGSGGFAWRSTTDELAEAPRLTLADVDASGRPDLAAIDGTRIVLLLDVGLDGAAARRVVVDAEERLRPLALHDVDFDGRLDLATASARFLLILRQRRDGGFDAPERYSVGYAPAEIAFAQLNGDESLDAVTADFGSRSVSFLAGTSGARARTIFRRGDADDDGRVRLTDAVAILENLFRAGPAASCPDAADANDDGRVDLTDAVNVLDYLFRAGREPPAPGPIRCGADPSDDTLGRCGATCVE